MQHQPFNDQAEYREIEEKYPLVNPKHVIERLNELNAHQVVATQFQEDTYYVPAHRNFLDEEIVSEWLRIRRTQNGCTINFKRWLPIGVPEQTHCDEYETSLTDVTAMEHILQAIDMIEIVRVTKQRSAWRLGGVEVAVDEVTKLGSFIELEAKVLLNDVDKAHKMLQETLSQLQAEVLPQDRRGYPYQLLNRES